VQTYALYIEDDRYSVPTLLFVTTADDAAVRRIAREKLSEPHHLAVEVRLDERVLFRLAPPSHDSDRSLPNSN
jgi:hypothetical protein